MPINKVSMRPDSPGQLMDMAAAALREAVIFREAVWDLLDALGDELADEMEHSERVSAAVEQIDALLAKHPPQIRTGDGDECEQCGAYVPSSSDDAVAQVLRGDRRRMAVWCDVPCYNAWAATVSPADFGPDGRYGAAK
jgi:hypothetical protein